jgi:hypothetical protein
VNNHNKIQTPDKKCRQYHVGWVGGENKYLKVTNYTKAEPEVMDMPELYYMVREGCYLLI